MTAVVAGLVAAGASSALLRRQLKAKQGDEVRTLAVDVIAASRKLWTAAQDLEYVIIEIQSERASGGSGRLDLEERRQDAFRERRQGREAGQHAAAALGLLAPTLEQPALAALQAAERFKHEKGQEMTAAYEALVAAFTDAVRAHTGTNATRWRMRSDRR